MWSSCFLYGVEKSQTQALDLISHLQRKSENHSPQHLLILSTGVFVSAMAPAGFNMAIMSRLHRALHARVSSPRSARSLLHQVQSKVDQGAEWQDMQGSPCGTGCWPTKALCGQSGSRCLVIPSGKQGCERLLGHLATIIWKIGSNLFNKQGWQGRERCTNNKCMKVRVWFVNDEGNQQNTTKRIFFSLRGWGYPPIPVPP